MDFDILNDTITPTPGSTLTISGGLLVTTGIQESSTNSITAAGTTQGTATALTTDYNVVTTTASGTGVVLPAGAAGRSISVVNRGANTLNVYPASGGTIDALASNAPTTLVTNATLTLQAITATQWYIVSNSGSAGGVTTFSAGTTGFTPNSATAGAITLAGTLVVANGGTNSSTALSGSSIMISNGTSVIQGAAGTTTTVLHGNAAGAPTYSAVSLTADVSGILPGANGGTNNSFMAFTGPTTTLKTFTLPDATTTILTTNAAVTPGQGGTGATATPTNGQLLIGNGTNYTVATLGSGTGISTTPGAGTLTINNTGVTSNVATANQTTVSGATGAVTIGLSSTLVAPGSLQVTTSMQASATNSITAAGTTQGTGTVLTTDYNVVTTTASGTGVVLPAGLAGRNAIVVNRGANALLVYPASGAQIDALGANVAVSVIVNGTLEVTAISATQWYIVTNSATGGGAVSSVSGTANQVTASPTTGAVVVSLPSTVVAPGTVQSTGSFIAGTATASVTSTLGTAIALVPGAAATTTSTGNAVSITGGPGGSTSGTGGIVSITGGVPTAGTGGTVFIFGANGIGTNQTGGNVTINAGSQTGTGTAGDVNISAGQLLAAGTPGRVLINGGNGSGSTTGGVVSLVGGSGGQTGAGATVFVTGGPGGSTSGNGGLAQFTGGTPVDGVGGAAQFSGAAGVGINRAGGQCLLLGGAGTGTASGGLASVQAGATVTGTGGVAYLTGGSGGTTGTGGDVSITTGAGGATSGNAGSAFLQGGTPVDGNGGTINITGSNGVGTNRNGGNVVVFAGNATGSGTAGFIQLSAGSIIVNGTNTGIQLTGITTEPAATPAGTMRIYAKSIAGRMLPKWIGTDGIDYVFQPSLSNNNIRAWKGGATTVATTFATNIGTMPYTGASPTAPTIPALAATNLLTQTRRSQISTGGVAGGLAYIRANQTECWIGNAAGLGGFYAVFRFAMTTLQTGNRVFVGLSDTVANPTNIDPTTSTTPGKMGLAINASTGNWSFVTNVTASAPTVTALGANFPVNTTALMELVLYSAPNGGSNVGWRVTNWSTNLQTSGTITTNLPTTATFLAPTMWCTNNATAAAVTMDFISCYLETDY